MSYRYMRIIIFFDLPVETLEQRRYYRSFRKVLINEGFIMMQESVYSKLVLNNTVGDAIKFKVSRNKPKSGIVQMMTITEKQFESVELLVGDNKSNKLGSTERLIII